MKRKFPLPDSIGDLIEARNRLKSEFTQSRLNFTLDGNLVGDIGEALAVQIFGLELVEKASQPGVDGIVAGKTVQVKATGTGRGPAFRFLEKSQRAEHLIFFDLDFEALEATVVFNGPEHIAISFLGEEWSNQRMVTPRQIRDADKLVSEEDRLRPIK